MCNFFASDVVLALVDGDVYISHHIYHNEVCNFFASDVVSALVDFL